MLYIPKRLQPYFNLISCKHGKNIVKKGNLKCTCSCQDFSIKYYGAIRQNWFGHQTLLPATCNNMAGVTVYAICSSCGKQICVFNSFTDGYDACVNPYPTQYCETYEDMKCLKCDKMHFKIQIALEYQSEDELVFDEIKDIENAFSWIWISLTCGNCNSKLSNFVEYETA